MYNIYEIERKSKKYRNKDLSVVKISKEEILLPVGLPVLSAVIKKNNLSSRR